MPFKILYQGGPLDGSVSDLKPDDHSAAIIIPRSDSAEISPGAFAAKVLLRYDFNQEVGEGEFDDGRVFEIRIYKFSGYIESKDLIKVP